MSQQSRLTGISACGLHERTPFGVANVSQTQMSIARYYGAIRIQGDTYTYFPDTDELVRDDVLRWQNAQKRAAKKKAKPLTANPR